VQVCVPGTHAPVETPGHGRDAVPVHVQSSLSRLSQLLSRPEQSSAAVGSTSPAHALQRLPPGIGWHVRKPNAQLPRPAVDGSAAE